MQKKPVTSYIDYRVFLRDYYEYEKAHTRHFSHRFFAGKAGISSSSFLSRVIEGKRNLTRPMIEKFSKAIKFTDNEAIYFKNLVLFNQAETAAEKTECYTILRSMKGIIKENVLQVDQYDYFRNWYTPVIRELLCLIPFSGDYAYLAKCVIPAISAREARESVELLLKLNLVKQCENGSYVQTLKSISADNHIKHLATREYTSGMIKNSLAAIDSIDRDRRHVSTMTLGVSQQQYKALFIELEAFKERVKQIVTGTDDASQVVELNLALFPVSQIIDNGKDGLIDNE